MKEKIPATPEPKFRYSVYLNGALAAQCVTKKAAQRLAALMGEPYFDRVLYARLKDRLKEEKHARCTEVGGDECQSSRDYPEADVG